MTGCLSVRVRRGAVALAIVLGMALPAFAQAPAPPAKVRPAAAKPSTGPAPLLDRQLFFGNPEIVGAQISPDGQYIAFITATLPQMNGATLTSELAQ